MPFTSQEIIISPEQEGQRLDNILVQVFPELSLRERRRLWDDWQIFVDNKAQGAGFRLRVGQKVRLEPKSLNKDAETKQKNDIPSALQAYILQEDQDFIFLYKPQGLHSMHIANGGPSLEGQLPSLLASECVDAQLCNRLDVQTSGIVVAGKDAEARKAWQNLENYGKCQKRYVAIVEYRGQDSERLAKSCTVKAALDTDKRKKSRVLDKDTHSLRHTHFQMLTEVDAKNYEALRQYFPSFQKSMPAELFFMGCTIYKGARHQIRAHAAHAGFGLFNDHRYNENTTDYTNECFVLHHGALILPHDNIYCPAPWAEALSPHVQEFITTFLQQNP